jgi:hypothetical protein
MKDTDKNLIRQKGIHHYDLPPDIDRAAGKNQ